MTTAITMTEEQKTAARWHWEEGNKYVVECGKALIAANAAAPTLFLTFNEKLHNASHHMFLDAVMFFGAGTVAAILLFGFGYEAQLQYGNFEIKNCDTNRMWRCAGTGLLVSLRSSARFCLASEWILQRGVSCDQMKLFIDGLFVRQTSY